VVSAKFSWDQRGVIFHPLGASRGAVFVQVPTAQDPCRSPCGDMDPLRQEIFRSQLYTACGPRGAVGWQNSERRRTAAELICPRFGLWAAVCDVDWLGNIRDLHRRLKRCVGALWAYFSVFPIQRKASQHPHLKWYTMTKRRPLAAKPTCTSVYKE